MARKKRHTRREQILGNHQRCWLWGRNLVLETLVARRWPILELHLADRLSDAERESAAEVATELNVPIVIESADRLRQLAQTRGHQGYLAKMGPFPYADATSVLDACGPTPLFLVLDSMQDPYNFGAVIRSAEVFGVDAVLIGERRQADVTSFVARSSVGAVNRIAIARTTDLAALVHQMRDTGIVVLGASEKADHPLSASNMTGPLAVVIGNEGTGITPEVASACDKLIKIPQFGEIGSLNAAVAGGILLYEATRQRKLTQ